MTGFTDSERHFLQQFKDGNAPFKSVLAKFCELKADEYRRSCTQRMAHIPRDREGAADDAAKAEAYETFMRELLGD
jgi:hypothetical protein